MSKDHLHPLNPLKNRVLKDPANYMKRLDDLEDRLKALENPTAINPSKTNGEVTTNPCGCVVAKDKNVYKHTSVLTANPQQEVSIGIFQCINCKRVIKVWQEVRVPEQPTIIIPGGG